MILRKWGNVAAFIFEPLVQGVAGMTMYRAEYLERMIKICKNNDVLTIADEVMTGFFRLGRMFASDFFKEKPDIMCLSKGLTGGFGPMGITTTTNKVFDHFFSKDRSKTFFHGHSYTGNPINCAAAIASLELLQQNSVQERIRSMEKSHFSFSHKMQKKAKIKHARVKGSILALEINTSEKTSYFNKIRDKLYRFYISNGILLRPLGNIVYIMPPYCISDEQLNKVYSVIEESIHILENE